MPVCSCTAITSGCLASTKLSLLKSPPFCVADTATKHSTHSPHANQLTNQRSQYIFIMMQSLIATNSAFCFMKLRQKGGKQQELIGKIRKQATFIPFWLWLSQVVQTVSL